MQPVDRSRLPFGSPSVRPPQFGAADAAPSREGGFETTPAPRQLTLAGPALLVEARFRDLTLATRLMRADLGPEERTASAERFTIGAGRGADAPVNPAYIGDAELGATLHALVESVPGNFILNLSAVMRPELITPTQRVALHADVGSVQAPLVIPADSVLRIPCGEVTFEITSAEAPPVIPRSWLPDDWRYQARFTGGAALGLLLALVIVSSIPSDPRALSLDDIAASHRLLAATVIPPVLPEPDVDRALDWLHQSGGSGSPAAAGPTGKAGDSKAPKIPAKRAIKGPPSPRDAAQVAADIRANTLLAVLDGPKMSSQVSKIFERTDAIGGSAAEVLGNLEGTTIASAYGVGGLGQLGTGAGGGGTHEGMLGGGGLGTIGAFGRGNGKGPGYGGGVGQLGRRQARGPDVLIGDGGHVRGNLDKEIIRRIVRRHLNEVRFCYEQELPHQPKLAGRMVVQFTIAPAGQVLASVMQSSTLNAVRVESCIVNAVRRWEFPAPSGGGLVMVSYPFQLAPAGSGD